MDRQRKIDAMLSTKVVLSKAEYIQHLLSQISEHNANLQHALESDKFHIVGAAAALIDENVKDLHIALEV